MPLTQEVHERLTEIELRSLIAGCDECECPQPCYCGSNREWAEQKLAELKKSSAQWGG